MQFVTDRVKTDFLKTCSAISRGSLRVVTPEGERHDFGQGLPQAELQINDWAMVTHCALRGDVGLGESYVAGLWDSPSIEAVGQIALLNMEQFSGYAFGSFFNRLKFRIVDTIVRVNSRSGSARNIRAHYDVGNEFYQQWLDPGMTYSSALFAPNDNDLARAQNRKYDRILQRLGQGETVLEIGCGWGGFAERAADQGRDVTAVTVSPVQKAYADARLDGRARIALCDYRDIKGKFDNIVSIEMVEAVGMRYWPAYFATIRDRLAEGGKAVIQAITVPDENFEIYRTSSDYIRQHVFPGGMLMCDAQIRQAAKAAGLRVRDSFAFGTDYARTCRQWQAEMAENAGRIMKLGYSEQFLRSWQYYLGICAASFERANTNVVQVELVHA